MGKTIRNIYLWLLGLGGAYFLWIRLTGLAPSCLVYELTGLQCGGCGTTRMILSLLRLDLAAAWGYNPVVLCLAVAWNVIALLCWLNKPAFVRSSRFLYTGLWVSVGAMTVFGVVRNFL